MEPKNFFDICKDIHPWFDRRADRPYLFALKDDLLYTALWLFHFSNIIAAAVKIQLLLSHELVNMKNLTRCIIFLFLASFVIFNIYYNSSKFPLRKDIFSGLHQDENYFIFENNSIIRLWIDVPNSFPWRKCLNIYRSQLHTYPCRNTYLAEEQIFRVITLPGDQTKFSLHHKELEIDCWNLNFINNWKEKS